MKRTVLDRDYIVIRIRREALRRALSIGAALVLILPYPLHNLTALPEPLARLLQWLPFSLGYAVLAPLALIALTSRAMTGAPVDGRLCVFCAVWHAANLILWGAGMLQLFTTLPPPSWIGAGTLLRILLFSGAGLWLFEILFPDMLGSYFWAGYFVSAGGCATLSELLRLGLQDLSLQDPVSRIAFFPLAAGALLCVIFLIAQLLQSGARRVRSDDRHYL